MKNPSLIVIVIIFSIISCSKDTSESAAGGNSTDNNWSINNDEVYDGGPGKDGIPSVDAPKFVSSIDIDYMSADDLVLGVQINNEIKGYTHPVLDQHEIVNDQVGTHELAITYCPLTGTGSAWERTINGQSNTFGVSGLLYRNNLIPYDRNTDSYWSQLNLASVHGELKGKSIITYPVVELPWSIWLEMFPYEMVITTETGFRRNYARYPYGDYKTNHNNILFPIGDEDTRLPAKERVFAIIQGDACKVYTFDLFKDSISVLVDQFLDSDVVVVGSQEHNFMVAYELNDQLVNAEFEPLQIGPGGIIMKDDLGNEYNIFGLIVSGPQEGTQLENINGMIGYWFSFGAFYDPEIFVK